MGYKTPQPDLASSFPEPKQQASVRRITERLDNLETATNQQSFSNGQKAPAPPKVGLSVTTNPKVKGTASVRITLPQFLTSKNNPSGAPMLHWTQASPIANFGASVTNFPVGPHTYFPVLELGSGTFYFQTRSSFDGQTWNQPVQSGKVVIP